MLVKTKFLADIPVDSIAAIAAANLLGDKFINITRGQDPRTVQPGAELQQPAGPGHSGADGAERQPAEIVPDHREARG